MRATRGWAGGRPSTCPKLMLDDRRLAGHARYESWDAPPITPREIAGGTNARTADADR